MTVPVKNSENKGYLAITKQLYNAPRRDASLTYKMAGLV